MATSHRAVPRNWSNKAFAYETEARGVEKEGLPLSSMVN